MVLEFVKSQRGKPKLKHEGYLYCLLREKDGLKTWRCDKRQCKAMASIKYVRHRKVFHKSNVIWNTSKKLGLEVLVVLEKEVNHCFQSLFGISSKMREMVTRRPITTLKAGIEPSNWAWDSLTPQLQNSCSICARSRASLKTALQEYALEKFCQSMPKWSVTASVFSNFSTTIKTIICCLF